MGRTIIILLAIPLVLVGGIWAYRLGSPHLSQDEASQKALAGAEELWGPQGSVVIGARFYPDASNLVDSRGRPVIVTLSGCPSWLPTPTSTICPPVSVWAVRVHIPGKIDEVFLVDATTGATEALLPELAPSTTG
jgi:hypothetical protein